MINFLKNTIKSAIKSGIRLEMDMLANWCTMKNIQKLKEGLMKVESVQIFMRMKCLRKGSHSFSLFIDSVFKMG